MTNFTLERVFQCGCKATYSFIDGKSKKYSTFNCSDWKQHKYVLSDVEKRLSEVALIMKLVIKERV